ncbi:NADH-quinone oxidoreductase subunit G [Salsipaludibacter albus]|uniref:NADH-quinone oxidoreductase subunit G n=1 Tax=Salsipaludibacter albus TaxID=2849650 RepID=UPI001EE4E3ED|nr:NADH-quinone oxidoreductase subunit G [Salsipaludibacter albus]MBY5161053.1 NADH-quinone oxidoreductase subunit G [Salsipaludibacter albus]
MTDTVTLTIDGKEITVPKGTLLIRAAEQLGTIIPRFCDHPLLDPVGACRQCIVEVEGQRKPMTACTTEAADGWVVNTHLTSDVARTAQEGQLEFLLINHPLDCPMCDKGGECPLQDQAMAHGNHHSRFVDEKRKYDKPVAVSAQVLLDRERCVLCARCTRFSDQVSGDPFIELFERGALEQVAIYEDEPYESYFSGNVIQICPVGALTSTSYRFKARPFDLRSTPSVCDGCSAGCSQTVQARRGQVERQLARTNMAVNEMWNCDKGRFGYGHLTADTRLTSPLVRSDDDGEEPVAADWATALTRVRSILAPDGEVVPTAVLSGGRLPDEDAYVAGKFARTVLGTDDVDFRTRFAPASEGDALAALAGRDTATYDDVEQAGVVLTVGLDPEEEVPILYLRLRKAWRNTKARLVSVGASSGSLAELLWRRLPTDVGAEAAVLDDLARALDRDGDDADQSSPMVAEVADALGSVDRPVVLVGERAGDGALAAAGRLADALGGKVAWVPRRSNARGALDQGLAAGLLPGLRRHDDDTQRAEVAAAWGLDELPTRGRDLHEILTLAGKGKIKVLYLLGVDLVRDVADQRLVDKALRRATVITHDIVANATTAHADVVLPVTASQERAGTRTNWEGRRQQFRPGVAGPQLVQHDWEILVQVTGMLGHDLGFTDLDGIRADMAALAPIDTTPDWPAAADRSDTAAAADDGDDTLTADVYPLLLDNGVHQVNAPDLAATAHDPHLRLHPDDAAPLGVSDGDEVTVTGGKAELTLPVRVTPDQAAGTVFVPANSTAPDQVDNPRHLGDRVTVAAVASGSATADQPVEVNA